jgi:hypothetical protein
MPDDTPSDVPVSSGLDLAGIGAWSKVGQDLIDIFSRRWVEPGTIIATAKANAEAYRIEEIAKTHVEIEKKELLHRAALRMANEAIREQGNIENVVKSAAAELPESAQPDKIDPDWTTSFMSHAGKISNAEMQSLWSKILAGEATKPGSFGKRTLNLVAELSKEDAHMFSTVCRYASGIGPLIFNFDDEIYTSNQVTYGSMLALKSSGLIDLMDLSEYALTKISKTFGVIYSDKTIIFTKAPNQISTGKVCFTPAGKELSQICKVDPVQGFFDYLLKKWYSIGAATPVANSEGMVTQVRMINAEGKDELSPFPVDFFRP